MTAALEALSLNEAVAQVERAFPNQGYLIEGRQDAWRMIARHTLKYVPVGARVLDFGAGPADTSAVLSRMGFSVDACDDMLDPWHCLPGMREKLLRFASEQGVRFTIVQVGEALPYAREHFDMIVLQHVIEHIGDSPRELLNTLVGMLKEGGYLFITVPSAVNIRKRIDLLRGRTNYPPYEQYWWTEGTWRGHRREYSRDDLERLANYLGLSVQELTTYHFMLHRVPRRAQWLYKAVTNVMTDWRDSWVLIAQKPKGWLPKLEPPSDLGFLGSIHMTGGGN